jgi:hypothetical protein
MMDDTTVQTTPAPRQPRETDCGAAPQTIRLDRALTTRLSPEGITFVIVTPVELESTGTMYSIRLHADGSACASRCEGPCESAAATEIALREEVTVGRWQWYGGIYALVGWHRFDANPAGKALRERYEEAAEDLAGERILHDLTREELAAAQRQRGKLRQALRRHREAATDAEHRYGIAIQVAWSGWSAAIILAVYLIESGLS